MNIIYMVVSNDTEECENFSEQIAAAYSDEALATTLCDKLNAIDSSEPWFVQTLKVNPTQTTAEIARLYDYDAY